MQTVAKQIALQVCPLQFWAWLLDFVGVVVCSCGPAAFCVGCLAVGAGRTVTRKRLVLWRSIFVSEALAIGEEAVRLMLFHGFYRFI